MTAQPVGLSGSRPRHGVEHLVVVRESTVTDRRVLLGMIHQTWARLGDVPAAEQMYDAGLGPIERPEDWGAAAIVRGRTRMWTFRPHPDVEVLYSQGSAAKEDVDQENAFCLELAAKIEAVRPRIVSTGPFSRVARAVEFSGGLYRALKHAGVEQLRTQETDIEMSSSAAGQLFSTFAGFADMERTSINSRMIIGKANAWRQGRFVLGSHAEVLGFPVERGRAAPDERFVPVVQAIAELLATDLTAAEVLDVLGRDWQLATPLQTGAGWQFGDLPDGSRRPLTIADMEDPAVQIKRFYSWLDVWTTGVLPAGRAVQWVGANNMIAGVPVEEGHDGIRRISTPVELGLPPGGFLMPGQLDAARTADAARDSRRYASGAERRNEDRLPLRGSKGWTVGAVERVLTPDSHANYQGYLLLERPVGSTRPASRLGGRPRTSWSFDPAAVRVGRFRADEMHAAVHAAVVAGARDGVPLELDGKNGYAGAHARQRLTGKISRIRLDPTAELRSALAAERAKAENLAGAIESAGSSTSRDQLAARLDASNIRADGLEAAIASAEAAPPRREPSPAAGQFTTEPNMIVAVLRALAGEKGRVPAEWARATTNVITDLRVEPGIIFCEFTFYLTVPVDGSVGKWGPFHGQVRNRAMLGRTVKPADHAAEVARVMMTTELTAADLSHRDDAQTWKGRQLRLNAAKALTRTHGMLPNHAAAILLCPFLPTRLAVWHALTDRQWEPPTPFAALVAERYVRDPTPGNGGWMRMTTDSRPRMIAALVAAGGKSTMARLAVDLGYTGADHRQWFNQVFYDSGAAPCAERGPQKCRTWGTDCGQPLCRNHGIRLRACPHPGCGGTLDGMVRVREIPGGLFCLTCMRMPDRADVVIPDPYATVTSQWYDTWLAEHVPDILGIRAGAQAYEDRKLQAREQAARETGMPTAAPRRQKKSRGATL